MVFEEGEPSDVEYDAEVLLKAGNRSAAGK